MHSLRCDLEVHSTAGKFASVSVTMRSEEKLSATYCLR